MEKYFPLKGKQDKGIKTKFCFFTNVVIAQHVLCTSMASTFTVPRL